LAYKKAIERAHPKQVTAVQRMHKKPAQPVTTNILYSQMASTSSTSRDKQSVPHTSMQQSEENNDPRLNVVLVALANVTQTLVSITARMDTLETNHSKSKNIKQKKK